MYMSCVLHDPQRGQLREICIKEQRREEHPPSPIDPTDDVPTESERVGGVAQPTLRALQHGAPVDEVVEHLAALREKVVQVRFGALQEGVLVERVLLSARAEHPPAEGVFCFLRGAV